MLYNPRIRSVIIVFTRPGMGAVFCDQPVCLSVREHIFGSAGPIFTKFFLPIPRGVARSSSGGVAIRYVLPVLWMTSRLAVMGPMAMRED